MDENFLKQLLAEMIEAQGFAIGLVVTAMCEQMDAAKLKDALHRTIEGAKQMPSTSQIAIRMATQAMAAADAAKMLQARPLSEGPHPKRAS